MPSLNSPLIFTVANVAGVVLRTMTSSSRNRSGASSAVSGKPSGSGTGTRSDRRGGAGQQADRCQERRRAAGRERAHDREEAEENLQRDQRGREVAERSRDRDLAEVEPRMCVRLAFETADQRGEVAAVHEWESG